MRPGPFVDPNKKSAITSLEPPQLPGVTRLLDLGKYKPFANKIVQNENEQSAVEQQVNKNENSPPKQVTSSPSKISTVGDEKSAVDEDYWMKEMVCIIM